MHNFSKFFKNPLDPNTHNEYTVVLKIISPGTGLLSGAGEFHTLPDTCVSDLGIISDMRILFNAYYSDEIQIKLICICRSDTQIIKFHDSNDYFINFNIILI